MGVSTFLIQPVGSSELRAALARTNVTRTNLKNANVLLTNVTNGAVRQDAPIALSAFAPAPSSLDILVAEDNPINQKIATAMLGKMGHRITLAANGVDTISQWTKAQFDLILMDVQMPEMDGLEATRRIRKIETTTGKHIPIIAVTANAMQGDREICLAAGMDDYIPKPIRPQLLVDTIQRLVAAAH
jgi:CheY-like chemotaxis protein